MYISQWINSQNNIIIIWGELQEDELYQTTMNPATRNLIQLTTENIEQTLELYNQLLGKQPSLRRDFILKNKLSKIDGDDVFDEFDDTFDE